MTEKIASENPLTKTTAPPKNRLRDRIVRDLIGAVIGSIVGWFLVKGIPGAAVGAFLAWYLLRSLWAGVLGGAFGWFFISGISGAAAGFVAGAMMGGGIVGRKGRWLILATAIIIVAATAIAHRDVILRTLGYLPATTSRQYSGTASQAA